MSFDTRAPRIRSGCSLSGGRWFSYYDGQTTRGSGTDFDVDHMVPLTEAWDFGARRWTAGTREQFTNDLADRPGLVAVSASSNRSKSDSDPAEWMPRQRARSRYVRHWVAVKTRWRLTVDRTEKRTLISTARGCRNVFVTVRTGGLFRRLTSGAI